MFKIQDILATKKSLKMLLDTHTKAGMRKSSNVSEPDVVEEKPVDKKVTFDDGKNNNLVENEDIIEVSSGDEDDMEIHELEKRRQAKRAERVLNSLNFC